MSKNLHQFYYNEYFKDIDWKNVKGEDASNEIKRKNSVLTSPNLFQPIKSQDDTHPFEESFQLEILYPGLVTGIGINHEASIEGEFKLGIHFDWTYGMPVIYGSSVKGVLRNYFEDFYKPNEDKPSVDDAKKDIFMGNDKSIYDRDIFFDAVIVRPDKKGRILCSDSITSHGGENHDNPLVNPNPITFLKIAPGCILEFRFKLVDTVIEKEGEKTELTKKEKLELFKEILTTVGIGAKTNVGYGQLK